MLGKHIRKYNQDNLLIVGGGDLYDSFVDKFGNEVSIHLQMALIIVIYVSIMQYPMFLSFQH